MYTRILCPRSARCWFECNPRTYLNSQWYPPPCRSILVVEYDNALYLTCGRFLRCHDLQPYPPLQHCQFPKSLLHFFSTANV
ncbi:hypothetical protein KC19_VG170900 [Ceratodon purpureus]|uniref:Uncharacterized protein n=1 Tax=Ceratodon purpureus TaxID=3225 RepID=A0A8T0HR02_CERPU|nr:hypothetical protein KC19_VG170900 [Ceratodon purpureus]